ncbi:class E sortase [Streptomyces sp. NBC_01142]|uniref:class E sortase n=1 Tax=Streptomyces sp. NBC_01142 TaxID=2975865 RepID=UPI0022500701|nr:class E sortase [Streptomyces sp. NBC_01142]MCX4824422.1 class E sortase [Streptomyces sp. NBC_01142]
MSAPRPEDEYDPLTDPLPPGEHGSPWFRAANVQEPEALEPQAQHQPHQHQPHQQQSHQQQSHQQQSHQHQPQPQHQPQEWYDPEGYQRDWYAEPAPAPAPATQRIPRPAAESVPELASEFVRGSVPEPTVVSDPVPVPDDETVALRTSDTRRAVETPAGPGRAERRRAAKGRGRRRPEPVPGVSGATAASHASAAPARPLSRVEARRAARAQKDSPAVIASRVTGELFITFGVLMLLFVTYQLWWTNILAGQQASQETNKIQEEWAKGRTPGAFEPGQGFAIMHIPKLDVVVPIAEGISKPKVLDRGMVGHYAEGQLKTAMPADKKGNFAVAGHRNTHGEPFRYINHLEPGDPIVVETQDAYYTYEMANILPQTAPSNVSVIGAVPPGSGFTGPGRYITLTTCTPEFTSTYRMIVWGKMVEERPRSKGKPDALVG